MCSTSNSETAEQRRQAQRQRRRECERRIEHKRPLNKGRSDWLDKGLPTGHAANWKERQTHREMQSQVMNDALNMKRHSCWESVQHR